MAAEITVKERPVVCFDEFRLDPQLRALYRGSEQVKLTPKPFATLEFLITNRQRVVHKTELLSSIWGGQREISTVEHAIGQLRRALGDTAEQGRYIETVPGQGYRFIAQVRPERAAPTEQERIESAPSQTIQPAHRLSRPLAASLACLGLLATGAAALYFNKPARVARAIWNGNTLVAMSDSGRVLWTYKFDAQLRETAWDESAWRTQIVDLDGDGVPEVLVATSFAVPGPGNPEELLCFSSRGKRLWSYKPEGGMVFRTPDLDGPWRFSHILVAREGRSAVIWAAVGHVVWWPSYVVRISNTGVGRRVFTSSGIVTSLRRIQTKTGAYVLAAGVNNGRGQATLTVLSENGPPSVSPESEGSEFQCIRGCPAASPYGFILLPRSEVNKASGSPYNMAVAMDPLREGFSVETSEFEANTAHYDFSEDLQPKRVAFGSGYKETHERFEREGRIHHSYKDCPERRTPAVLTVRDQQGNWSTISVPRVPISH